MDVIYKCKCMPVEQSINVPDRLRDEEIVAWLNKISFDIALDHEARSPRCGEASMVYLKIPMNEHTQLGTPLKLQS